MASAIRASPRTIRAGTVVFIHISAQILNIMAKIALVIFGMASVCVRLRNVGALQRILFAAWAGADNTSGCTGCHLRGRFLSSGFCFRWRCTICVGVHAVQIVEISVAAVGSRPIIGIERHRRFRIANDIRNIKCVAGIGFAPESVLTNAFQNGLAVIHCDCTQLGTAIKCVLANDRGERQLGGGQVDAALEPVCQIWDGQRFHVLKPDLGDLVADTADRPHW